MEQPSHPGVYDCIGRGYLRHRDPDPRIEAQIHAALGNAHTVVNVGAGTGAYEPPDREVTAVEPSRAMIAQRVAGRVEGRVLRAVAERLPFSTGAFDAAMASLTLHHWTDISAGLAELRRVARGCVIFTFDPQLQRRLWLIRDYFPDVADFETTRHPPIERLANELGADRVEVVPIPWNCSDGFQAAYWRRPEKYLDPAVRANISTFAQRAEAEFSPGLRRLERDITSGAWRDRYAELLQCDEWDFGYRLVVRDA